MTYKPYQFEPEGNLPEEDDLKPIKRNYNQRQSRERSCDVRAFKFSPSRLRIWLLM